MSGDHMREAGGHPSEEVLHRKFGNAPLSPLLTTGATRVS